MRNKTLTVEELNGYIHSIFQAEEMLFGVSVFGEISGCKVSGPHAYFTMKGKEAAIPCTLFQYRRTYLPKDGESVIVKGTPDYYVKTGKLSFQVSSVQPVGIGDLHAALEALKAKLLKEGVFAPEHKKPIPAYPKDVCVITSKTGAVIRDICRTIRNVNQSINIHLYNVRVQGQDAEKEIAEGIKQTDGKYDVIIIARGGGSFEDLAPFNTELIARTIYEANTPIISAVGHETDFTVCDLAADSRAATPTAAGHMVAFDEGELIRGIFDRLTEMGLTLQERASDEERRLIDTLRGITRGGSRLTEKKSSMMKLIWERMLSSGKNYLNEKENRLQKALIAYGASDPLAILKKGYFGVTKDGKRVLSVRELAINDDILLSGKDGSIRAMVKEMVK